MKPLRIILATLVATACTSLAQTTLLTDLVAYWNFEGSASNHPAASGGSGFNGTLMGGATTTGTPKVGTGALLLDGVDNYCDVTTNVNVNQPWTVSAWFQAAVLPTGTTRAFVYESVGASSSVGYSMSFGIREGTTTTDTNYQLFTDNTPAGDASAILSVTDANTLNTWHHILSVFTPATISTSGSITGYLDGSVVFNLVIPAGNTLVNSTGFHIGTYRGQDARWFNGSIDDVAIWSRQLTALEIQEVYDKGLLGESFVGEPLTITLTATPSTGGTVSGSGVHDANDEVTISATPAPGYLFDSWTGGFSGQPQNFVHIMSASVTSTAVFVPDTADTDGDGLSNFTEISVYHTSPILSDTDGDQIPDGDEVLITKTNPTMDDSTLVEFVEQNLTVASAGIIALGSASLQMNADTRLVSLLLPFWSSLDQINWAEVNLGSPLSAITPAGNGFEIILPAPSETLNGYTLTGKKP